MQHRYVADIGDFGKYGLLNALLAGEQKRALRLGVLWCLTHPSGKEVHRNDGKHTAYLTDPRHRSLTECNPHLHTRLKRLHAKRRHLSGVQAEAILPTDTIYVDEPAEESTLPPVYRLLYRQSYLARAAISLREADLIFCDPDNGISDKLTTTGGKSILLAELELFWKLGKSLLVYNHRPRVAESVLRARYAQFKQVLGCSQLIVFRFRKGSQRDFLLFAQPQHHRLLKLPIANFQQSLWVQRGLFEQFAV